MRIYFGTSLRPGLWVWAFGRTWSVKRTRGELFSERHGSIPAWRCCGFTFVVRKPTRYD